MSRSSIPKATHQGKLKIGGIEISCSVLEDGTRLLSERSVGDALGTKASAAYWKAKREGKSGIIPQYVAANNLAPYITDDLRQKFSQSVTYKAINGKLANGIPAEVLPEICSVWIVASKEGAITQKQEHISEKAYVLLKGFANVGIIALVDEATGYQYDREAQELQKILSAYISNELLPWQQRFPHEFYREIFRLRGWSYTSANIRKKPSVVGHWTNRLVYGQLPRGVLKELKEQTPKDSKGRRKHHYHRLLSTDVGHPHLGKQLAVVIALMNISKTWKEFIKHFNTKFGQQEISFDEVEEVREIPDDRELSDFNKKLKQGLDYNPNKDKK